MNKRSKQTKKGDIHPNNNTPAFLSFHTPGLSGETCSHINQVWQSHLLEKRKDFRKAMTKLVIHLTQKDDTFEEIKQSLMFLGENTPKTKDLIRLYNLCDIPETPSMVKFKRLDHWEMAQQVLTADLLEIIKEKVTQPYEAKRLLEEQKQFLIENWGIPKLSIFVWDSFADPLEQRALHKGLIKIIMIDTYCDKSRFPSIVATLSTEIGKYENYLKMEIYSGIEEKEIATTKFPFQIFNINAFSDEELEVRSMSSENAQKFLDDFDLQQYRIAAYLEVYNKAQELKDQKCWSDGRIWVTTTSIINPELEEST